MRTKQEIKDRLMFVCENPNEWNLVEAIVLKWVLNEEKGY